MSAFEQDREYYFLLDSAKKAYDLYKKENNCISPDLSYEWPLFLSAFRSGALLGISLGIAPHVLDFPEEEKK